MVIAEIIIAICWIIFLFYWIINWKKVKLTQNVKIEKSRFNEKFIILIIFSVAFLAGFNILPPCQLTKQGCYLSPIEQTISIVLVTTGLGIAIIARKTLADNWSATLDLKKGHKLITSGVYGYIRHPIYTGILFMGLGTILVFQSFLTLIIYLLIIIIILFRIKNEEHLMIKAFPNEYPKYKKHVKVLFPFVY